MSVSEKQFYVLRCQSNREQSVAEALRRTVEQENLTDRITQILVPTQKVQELKNGRKVVRNRKLYPGYILIEMELTDDTWYTILNTQGVGNFIGNKDQPIPMEQYEVERILGTMTGEEEEPELHIDFKVGDPVKIKEGPFENFDALVEEVHPDKGTVKVTVTIFGRSTQIELEYWMIEKQ